MERQAQAQYRRFISAFTRHFASLPTGNLLSMLDLLARAQFMEALTGHPFHTVSARASSSKRNLRLAIGHMMLEVDPTLDPNQSVWTADGAVGLYRAAWLGANRIFAKTQSAMEGVPLEATDLLNANLLQALDTSRFDKMTPDQLAEELKGLPEATRAVILRQQAEAINEQALTDVSIGRGNFFFEAGKRFRGKKLAVVNGEVDMDTVGGAVAMYAKNAAINAMEKRNTEMKAQLAALEAEMLPGEGEVGDFDVSSMSLMGFDGLVQAVLTDPNSSFAMDFLVWLDQDVMGTLTPNEQAVMRPYVGVVMNGQSPLSNDAYARSLGMTPQYFGQVRNKFLANAFRKFKTSPPAFLSEAENQLFLRSLATGRIRAASGTQGGDAALRTGLIRLAHERPEVRAHVLPLLKEAAKASAKLKGKKLDALISSTYYKHGDRVQIDMMSIPKIYSAATAAYEAAGTPDEGVAAVEESIKASIAKFRVAKEASVARVAALDLNPVQTTKLGDLKDALQAFMRTFEDDKEDLEEDAYTLWGAVEDLMRMVKKLGGGRMAADLSPSAVWGKLSKDDRHELVSRFTSDDGYAQKASKFSYAQLVAPLKSDPSEKEALDDMILSFAD